MSTCGNITMDAKVPQVVNAVTFTPTAKLTAQARPFIKSKPRSRSGRVPSVDRHCNV